ncbi:MAG: hypothetical protein PVI90_00560 [Desulfobacteraceae bacterium]|jgi:hypothetical protein
MNTTLLHKEKYNLYVLLRGSLLMELRPAYFKHLLPELYTWLYMYHFAQKGYINEHRYHTHCMTETVGIELLKAMLATGVREWIDVEDYFDLYVTPCWKEQAWRSYLGR